MTYIAPATKILRYPETLAAMQRGERVWPLHVEMDLAGVCNLACGWCRFGDGRQGGGLMDEALAADIIEQLADGGTRAVTFSGGGEPSVNPALASLAMFANRQGLKVGIYSNGVNRARLVAAAPWCEWIYISLDAADAQSYERAKGRDEFEQVRGTIVALRGRTRTLGVGFLLTGDNWSDIGRMRRLGMELGADYVQFRPVAGLADYAWVADALRVLEALPSVVYAPQRFTDLAAGDAYERGYSICRASALSPCIGADGTVWACPNTRGLAGRSIGNACKQRLAEIFANAPVQMVGPDCEPTCRHHNLNKTLALVCERQAHEEFI